MNRFYLSVLFCLSFLSIKAQGKVYVTNTEGAQGVGNSMFYALPQTAFDIDVYATQIERQAGPYWKYAKRYLGEDGAITENSTEWKIDRLVLRAVGIPDPKQYYQVVTNGNVAAAFLSLTPEGLIKGVNISETSAAETEATPAINKAVVLPSSTSLNNEAMVNSGATFKEAEEAANQIFRLREGRTALITGDNDAHASGSDTKSMLDEINKQEQLLLEQFLGKSISKQVVKTVRYIPEKNKNNDIVFRFSKYRGIVESSDLSGAPVTINIKEHPTVALPAIAPLTPEEEKKKNRNKKEDERFGFYYRRPGKAEVVISYNGQDYVQQECDIAQYGEVLSLAPEIGERPDSRIVFFTNTGAIKEISRTK